MNENRVKSKSCKCCVGRKHTVHGNDKTEGGTWIVIRFSVPPQCRKIWTAIFAGKNQKKEGKWKFQVFKKIKIWSFKKLEKILFLNFFKNKKK